jgi:hypothetical protein
MKKIILDLLEIAGDIFGNVIIIVGIALFLMIFFVITIDYIKRKRNFYNAEVVEEKQFEINKLNLKGKPCIVKGGVNDFYFEITLNYGWKNFNLHRAIFNEFPSEFSNKNVKIHYFRIELINDDLIYITKLDFKNLLNEIKLIRKNLYNKSMIIIYKHKIKDEFIITFPQGILNREFLFYFISLIEIEETKSKNLIGWFNIPKKRTLIEVFKKEPKKNPNRIMISSKRKVVDSAFCFCAISEKNKEEELYLEIDKDIYWGGDFNFKSEIEKKDNPIKFINPINYFNDFNEILIIGKYVNFLRKLKDIISQIFGGILRLIALLLFVVLFFKSERDILFKYLKDFFEWVGLV